MSHEDSPPPTPTTWTPGAICAACGQPIVAAADATPLHLRGAALELLHARPCATTLLQAAIARVARSGRRRPR